MRRRAQAPVRTLAVGQLPLRPEDQLRMGVLRPRSTGNAAAATASAAAAAQTQQQQRVRSTQHAAFLSLLLGGVSCV